MKFQKSLVALFILSVVVYSCGPAKKGGEGESKTTQEKKYNVYKAPDSYEFPEAQLYLEGSGNELDTGETIFKFKVSNYELGAQTPDATERGLANSGKGQHIHFIMDNDPYSAHYEPEFSKRLDEGNHVLLAFLSRSYHESVKNPDAFIVQEFVVGSPEESSSFDATAEHMFYSRPKGTYEGKDTEKLLLDFFLYNTTLAEDGNKVRATINGEEYLFTEWAPYYIEGLEKGEVTIKLELIDNEGNIIPGPYNSVTRKVTLK